MTTFDDREKSYESNFAREEELSFKINARRHKLLGLWAAEKLGKKGAEADGYAKDVVLMEFESGGEKAIEEKLLKDFAQAKIALTAKEIQAEMNRLFAIATKQIMEAKK